jgi:hypothetical protein
LVVNLTTLLERKGLAENFFFDFDHVAPATPLATSTVLHAIPEKKSPTPDMQAVER